MRNYLYLFAAILFSYGLMAPSNTSAESEREKLIDASQSGASPLFFNPAAPGPAFIQPGDFDNPKEFTLRNGLPNFLEKARAGKPVTVGYIGGSITQAL